MDAIAIAKKKKKTVPGYGKSSEKLGAWKPEECGSKVCAKEQEQRKGQRSRAELTPQEMPQS